MNGVMMDQANCKAIYCKKYQNSLENGESSYEKREKTAKNNKKNDILFPSVLFNNLKIMIQSALF